MLDHRDGRRENSNAQNSKLWSMQWEFGILRTGEVQGYILWLGNGTGGHHECCS